MIIGILGSGSDDSLTRQAMAIVAQQVHAAEAAFDLVDLRSEFRELHDIGAWASPSADSVTARIRTRIRRARGVVLATPVYHGSFSGLLKNALDHLEGEAFDGLPVGTLAAGGGPRSASVACEQLRSVIRAMGGWSTPSHVGLTYGDIGPQGPTEALRRRIGCMIAEILEFRVRRHASETQGASDA